MRVALCLGGPPRTWEHTIKTLPTWFDGVETVVFLHAWSGEEKISEVERMRAAYQDFSGNEVQLIETLRPTQYQKAKAEMARRWPNSATPFSFDMFESNLETIGRAAADPTFDLIVRMRPDTVFDGVCPPTVFKRALEDKTVVVPNNFTPVTQAMIGCNDQFAVGTPRAMTIYSNIAYWLPDVVGDTELLPDEMFKVIDPSEAEQKRLDTMVDGVTGMVFRPEFALAHYLGLSGVSIDRQPLALTLLRETMVGRPFANLPQDITAVNEGEKAARDALVIEAMSASSARIALAITTKDRRNLAL